MLAVLAFASLAYVAGRIPIAQLRAMLIAPRAPVQSVPMQKNATTASSGGGRRFSAFVYHPAAMHVLAKPVASEQVPSSASVSGIGSATGTATDTVGDLFVNEAKPPAIVPQPKPAPERVRVGGQVAAANLVYDPQPSYPALARSARVQGDVEFTAVISKTGSIQKLQLVHGHPLLVEAAKRAVVQWRYRPTLLNGQPVEVVTDIVVRFSLAR